MEIIHHSFLFKKDEYVEVDDTPTSPPEEVQLQPPAPSTPQLSRILPMPRTQRSQASMLSHEENDDDNAISRYIALKHGL